MRAAKDKTEYLVNIEHSNLGKLNDYIHIAAQFSIYLSLNLYSLVENFPALNCQF